MGLGVGAFEQARGTAALARQQHHARTQAGGRLVSVRVRVRVGVRVGVRVT